MLTVLIDYDSGNLHSAEKAFQRMALEVDGGDVIVTDRPEDVLRADRIVLPGDGAFPACKQALQDKTGLHEALLTQVETKARPFMGICIGMQMMASWGREYTDTPGFDWIGGEVVKIQPAHPTFKVPHMGWNDLVVSGDHPVMAGVKTGDHAYFVHSYHMVVADSASRLAHVDYGEAVTAIVGRDTMIGTQFHPEKSQETGLRMIANFLTWHP
ncbi:imidazole glycerol phosphate synthase subunit HisH [Actibacterium sp. 188UL27-1]|uniref:imidazole glycerol phosphate synthase subunit HisH n=1 Tax=Actibacterium sp. 188UL27-1 TaxID=2786961 RepID=UPI0019587BBC|nr:imidazole glycerol phosphate synthase subunit HisH [Actibacterium sp. 188UL27-1]MBM7069255.1 imidazole glycerol phosphate synthase subunit HisH [Actibacterium sp. 188UL27-1]